MGSYTGSLSKENLLAASPKVKFIEAVNNGQVAKEDINKWLVKDFQFLLAYVNFIEHIHDIAPENTKAFWDDAVGAIEEEIVWFDKALKERGINTEVIKQNADSDENDHWLYEYMETKKSYLALATTVYAFELAGYEAWSKSKSSELRRFANRWGTRTAKKFSDEFGTYVDKEAKVASEADQNEGREVWSTIMKIESEHDVFVTPKTTAATTASLASTASSAPTASSGTADSSAPTTSSATTASSAITVTTTLTN
jgi:thiaminase